MENKEWFYIVRDPRRDRGKIKHSLENVLRLALLGAICGCETYDDIEEFVEDRLEEFKEAGLVSEDCGEPSADTFRRLIESVNPEQLNACLIKYNSDILDTLAEKQIAIDGKKLRGMAPKTTSAEKGLYILNAWVSENEICVGQVKVEDKSNEITAIPKMIDALDITDAVVSIDAIGTQRDISSLIVARGGHYFLSLKENQKNLLEEVECAFRLNQAHGEHSEQDTGHGRREVRTCKILPVSVLEGEAAYVPWPYLKTIVKIERIRDANGKCTKETAYFISDEEVKSARYYSMVARGHWGIENQLHWTLDVVFKEDSNRTRTGYGPQNLSTLRKLALSIIKGANDKRSMVQRRKKCMRNTDYLKSILLNC